MKEPAGPAGEAEAHRLKRLRLRSWRRGTKEMDLILGPYADAELDRMDGGALDAYEALLTENDQDLYAWVSGQAPVPESLAQPLTRIRRFHGIAAES